MAMKVIFGFNVPYLDCLRTAGIQRLDERRNALFQKFTEKAYSSPIWRERWFTQKIPSSYNLRREDVVVQHFAAKQRLQRSPLNCVRAYINERHRLQPQVAAGSDSAGPHSQEDCQE